ncbi:hypothetical protein [Vibrio alginolyticus]|uniref:hypothetical protein n=1 Tax=Vibrio alginolyticus TaxID=663 RepID=UPI0006CAA6FB|nr:hypothetical protein [Vibrio alginolyticus]KPM98658.1 hypothetical protein AOG25_09575 [Vibrio alginolyticus]CAH7165879.1 conserved exported hypothetical protein [Vibrio chagasii]CAH7335725.1 conserved exported hypothetical protein [Vibrio chagasii]
MMKRKLSGIFLSLMFTSSVMANSNWYFDLDFGKPIEDQDVQKRQVANNEIQSDGTYVWQFIPVTTLDADFDYFAAYVTPISGSITSIEAVKNYDSLQKCSLAKSYIETTKLDGFFKQFTKVNIEENKDLPDSKNELDITMFLNNIDDNILQVGCIKSTIFPDKHALIISVSSEKLQEKLKDEYTQYLIKN